MRALVTGGQGFVGRHLRDHLEHSGDSDVTPNTFLDVTDRARLDAVVAASRPDVIFHLAALSSVAASFADARRCTEVNVVGTNNVLQAAHDHVPDALTIVISSSEVYGISPAGHQPLDEHTLLAPANPYAASKVEAEAAAHDAHWRRGQRTLVLRPFTHIGPGQAPRFFVPALVDRLLEAQVHGGDVAVGNLMARRDFTDVRDVVRAYRLLALYGQAGETYNVASGHDVALADIAADLRALVHPTATFVEDPTLFRPVDVPVLRGDPTKLHEATGWEPVIPLEQTLRDVIADRRRARA